MRWLTAAFQIFLTESHRIRAHGNGLAQPPPQLQDWMSLEVRAHRNVELEARVAQAWQIRQRTHARPPPIRDGRDVCPGAAPVPNPTRYCEAPVIPLQECPLTFRGPTLTPPASCLPPWGHQCLPPWRAQMPASLAGTCLAKFYLFAGPGPNCTVSFIHTANPNMSLLNQQHTTSPAHNVGIPAFIPNGISDNS